MQQCCMVFTFLGLFGLHAMQYLGFKFKYNDERTQNCFSLNNLVYLIFLHLFRLHAKISHWGRNTKKGKKTSGWSHKEIFHL
jgi:hypothetical protein